MTFFGLFWLLGAGIHKLELKINSACHLPWGHSICSPIYCLWLRPYTPAEGSPRTVVTRPMKAEIYQKSMLGQPPLVLLNIASQSQLLAIYEHTNFLQIILFFPYICLICQKIYDFIQKVNREGKQISKLLFVNNKTTLQQQSP